MSARELLIVALLGATACDASTSRHAHDAGGIAHDAADDAWTSDAPDAQPRDGGRARADAGPPVDAAAAPPASCGDGLCAPTDSCATCPVDCGTCDTLPALGDVTIELGAEEVVWSAPSQQCVPGDLPDTNAHAMRIGGHVVLVAGNAPVLYTMEGPDFDSLTRRCEPAFVSGDAWTASAYAHQEWIASTYFDGTTVHALVHDEFHDPVAPNCDPGVTTPANPCWWNSITYASSVDGARTFHHPTASPGLVAPAPVRWDPTPPTSSVRVPPPHGYMEPSNIVHGPDGNYYALIRAMPSRTDATVNGTCAIRTADLADPSAWRFWTGRAWDGTFVDSYSVRAGDTVPTCAFVSNDRIRSLHGSLTYNTFLGRWLLLGGEIFSRTGTNECGFFASTSEDFVTWSDPVLVRSSVLPWLAECASPSVTIEAYPSFIDHDDDTPSFERTGQSPYLYFMRWHASGGEDRDLVRQRVTLHRTTS